MSSLKAMLRNMFFEGNNLVGRIISILRINPESWSNIRQLLIEVRTEIDSQNQQLMFGTENTSMFSEILTETTAQWNLISDLIKVIEKHTIGEDGPFPQGSDSPFPHE